MNKTPGHAIVFYLVRFDAYPMSLNFSSMKASTWTFISLKEPPRDRIWFDEHPHQVLGQGGDQGTREKSRLYTQTTNIHLTIIHPNYIKCSLQYQG